MKRGPAAVLVVDDQVYFPQAARAILGLTDDFEVVGDAASVAEALQLLDQLAVDLVLMDVNMEPVNGIEGARQVLSRADPPAVVLCSTMPLDKLPPIPAELGVSFLYKGDLDPESLLAAWQR